MPNLKKIGSTFILFFLSTGFARTNESSTVALLPVPLVRQSTEYTCGPSALQAILVYYGQEFLESVIAKETKADPQFGTESLALVKFATDHGIEAHFEVEVTLEKLRQSLSEKNPIIVDIQAWRDEGNKKPYADDWDDGHYVVLIGMDQKTGYFVDPSLLGSRGTLSISDFEKRWHDLEDRDAKRFHRSAIFFRATPKPPPAWSPIE